MIHLAAYTSYHSEEQAKELTDLLESAGIPYVIEHDKDVLDKVYIGHNLDPMIVVKISPDKFEQVNELLRSNAKEHFNNIHPDYYLFNFTNEELKDVVRNKEEWNAFDQGLAEKILLDRNVEFDKLSPNSELNANYTRSKVTGLILIVEYIIAVYIPYAGILIGIATIAAFRTLHTGKRVKIYDEASRLHGKVMIAIGIARTFIYLFIYF